MKKENAIEVNNITKSFKVYMDKGQTLKEKLIFKKRNRYEERKVLKGISFNVKKGEAIGLIGHNGCGKSTTLKLLTKIIYPDTGTIEMKGRVSSLIELGAGFHPDMSGRENIYTNAAIFGLTKKEIDNRIDDIIEFSELEEFIDNPVRTYSSGMYMRLAFSVAINVDAEILLIDEILAVGDAGFQSKCFNKLQQIKSEGTTIVIVSHSLGQIEQICDRCLWIDKGYIKEEGTPIEVDQKYLEYMAREREEVSKKELKKKKERTKNGEECSVKKEEDKEKNKNPNRWGSREAYITNVSLYDSKHEETTGFTTNGKMVIRIEYKVEKTVENACVGIGIFKTDGINCFGVNTTLSKIERYNLEEDGVIIAEIEDLSLLSGNYWLDVAIEKGQGIPIDFWRDAIRFSVFSPTGEVGLFHMPVEWKLNLNKQG